MPTLTGDAGIQRKIAKTQMEIYDNILINSSEIVFHKIQLKLDLFFESHTQPHFTKKKNNSQHNLLHVQNKFSKMQLADLAVVFNAPKCGKIHHPLNRFPINFQMTILLSKLTL